MKTKLLYITSFLLVCFTSCSVDETSSELTTDKNDLIVKNLFDMFSKNVVNSKSYSKFIDDIAVKSSDGLSEEELQQIEQDFLSKQSEEFIQLYNHVVALNLSRDEIRRIILDYVSVQGKHSFQRFSKNDKNDGDECAAIGATETSPLFIFIAELWCEMRTDDSDENQEENED